MALQATFIFICAGLTGIQSMSTVEHVSVEVGNTVLIPCQYEDDHADKVKYLCRGFAWTSCSYEIKTDGANSEKYSINDDKIRKVVTFTIKNLTFEDADYYWCAVEKNGVDQGEQFRLSVSKKGESRLHVDSQFITGYLGDQVSISCKCNSSELKQWCRIGGPCVSSTGQIDGALVTTETSVPGQFAVTMTGLWERNIGWYWCSCGDLQMPVFLDVTVKPTTTTIATTTVLSTKDSTASPNKSGGKSISDYLIAAAIALCFLVFVAVMALVIWHWLRRNMKKMEAVLSFPEQSTDDLEYGNVSRGPTSHQNPCPDNGTEILYKTVSFKNNPVSRKVKVKEEDVVYSTVVV